jgi:D-3-phosphoglycerate dehydrogenase
LEEGLLSKHGYVLDLFEGSNDDHAAKIRFAAGAVGVFVRWTMVDEEFLSSCPLLKVIIRYGAGYENIDLDAANASGVKVANVGGYGNHSVSDHALSLIYACTRGLFPGTAGILEHFGKPPFQRVFELHRKTLGIIGLGRIGGTLARKAGGLFQKVLASDPYIPDKRFLELGVEKTSFKDVLRQSHVISIHCNLTEETRHLLDTEAFTRMEHQPYVINTARGPVIETDALLEALDKNLIPGAGLDVFDSELPEEINPRILAHPRIIATGHYAWYSENSLEELQKRAAENMVALLQNRSIEDALN